MKRTLSILLYSLLVLPLLAQPSSRYPNQLELTGFRTNFNRRGPDAHGLYIAANHTIYHKLGFYIDDAYSGYLTNSANVQRNYGYDVSGGIVYELQYNRFLFQCGLEVNWNANKMKLPSDTIVREGVIDKTTDTYTLKYYFEDRVDSAFNLRLQIPILFGMEINRFYFLAGSKLRFQVYGGSGVRVRCTTIGIYDQYFVPFEEMDDHGLRKDVPLLKDGKRLRIKPDLLLSAEAGYNYRTKSTFPVELRIAAFAEIGLLNLSPKTKEHYLYIPDAYQWDFKMFEMNHYLVTDFADKPKVHEFAAGIKLTVLFTAAKDVKCSQCNKYMRVQRPCKICRTMHD